MARLALSLVVLAALAGFAWLLATTGSTSAGDAVVTKERESRDDALDGGPPIDVLSLPDIDPGAETQSRSGRDEIKARAGSTRRYPKDAELARAYDALSLASLSFEVTRLEKVVDSWQSKLMTERFANGRYEVARKATHENKTEFSYEPGDPKYKDLFVGTRILKTGEVRMSVLPKSEYPDVYALRDRLRVAKERLEVKERAEGK